MVRTQALLILTTNHFLLPTSYCLLPTASCLLCHSDSLANRRVGVEPDHCPAGRVGVGFVERRQTGERSGIRVCAAMFQSVSVRLTFKAPADSVIERFVKGENCHKEELYRDDNPRLQRRVGERFHILSGQTANKQIAQRERCERKDEAHGNHLPEMSVNVMSDFVSEDGFDFVLFEVG